MPRTSSAARNQFATSSADLFIGNNGPPFNGAIDEVAIYNTALSTAQIQAIYAAGSVGKCPSPPIITSQPVPDTLFAGGTASFGVAANGLRPFGYQWYLGTNPIPAASNLTATNALLVLTNVQVGQSGGLYSVQITNSAGETNSSSALLTVNPVSVVCDPAPLGLVSWWAGQGNANDSFGTNNGALVGGVTYTNGEVGQAFSFNGSTADVDVPDSPSLELTSQITIEAWINPLITNGDQVVLGKLNTAFNGYQFGLTLGNQLFGSFNSPGLSWPSSVITSPVPVVPGTWYHVAWTYDQSAMKLYFNGQPVATNVIGAHPIATSSADVTIGYGPYFHGAIDEPAIYNTALSAAQIQAIYNAGSAGKCPSPPVIVTQPASNTLFAGGTASFGVAANGFRPLSYQWYLGTNPISATTNVTATNATLVLSNVQVGLSGGLYSVLITNSVGQTNSASALLTVNALPATCDPAPAGLVSWWAGQSNANDSFGTNNGSLVGGVTFTNGEVGQAFSFNGSTAYVDVPNSLSLGLTNQITIEAWIKPLTTNGDQSIVAKIGTDNGLHGFQFGMHNNQWGGQFNSFPGQAWASYIIDSPIPMALGAWNHVVWTYDQSAMKLYLNGQPVATNVIGAQPIASSTADLSIGGNGPPFTGAIDELSVYNTALSAAQIQAIYNAGSAGKCPSPPVIVTQPASNSLFAGGTASFGVAANGLRPFGYQWYLGTNPISAMANSTATNSVLVLTNVQLGQSGGLYSVLVTNSAGQTNSASALLTVNPLSITCDPAPAGLISWWAAESNANDSFGNNNGTLVGAVTYTNGEVGQAFYFNGTTAYVDVPDSPSLQLTNQITIEAWIKPVNANGDQSMVAKIATSGHKHPAITATTSIGCEHPLVHSGFGCLQPVLPEGFAQTRSRSKSVAIETS